MGLLLLILSVAGLFLALHAQFLAAIQLIVYAGRDRRPLPLRHHAPRPERDAAARPPRAGRARLRRGPLRRSPALGALVAVARARRDALRMPVAADAATSAASTHFGQRALLRRARALRALERPPHGRGRRRRRGRARRQGSATRSSKAELRGRRRPRAPRPRRSTRGVFSHEITWASPPTGAGTQ